MSNLHLPEMFGLPEWLDQDEVAEDLSIFPELSVLSTYAVAGTLATIEREGVLPPDMTDIFEFGSGQGEGLIGLDMLARSLDEVTVTGSEITESALGLSRSVAGILESVAEVEYDGLAALGSKPESVDVVLANMFGPCYNDKLRITSFAPVAIDALKASGVIIINSDQETMANVSSWANDNLRQDQVEMMNPDLFPSGLRHMPHMVITK